MDKLLNKYSFTYTRTAEKTDFSAFWVWLQKINDLYACFKYFYSRTLLLKGRCITVYTVTRCIGRYRPTAINRLAQNIENPAQCSLTYRHLYTCTHSLNVHTAGQTFAFGKHYTAYSLAVNMLSNLHNACLAVRLRL